MKIKTASDLKFQHETNHPQSLFFSRNNMKFAGDTMKNFGIRQPREVEDLYGNMVLAYELVRKQTVKGGNRGSFFFETKTFGRIHTKR